METPENETAAAGSSDLFNDQPECAACAEREDACPDCARKIHEQWHEAGMWWIRAELCHDGCPGRAKDQSLNAKGEPQG